MRECLLNLALDYSMVNFIMKCVQEWAAGEFVHLGCTLKFLLDWAWEKVSLVKSTIDATCKSNFSFSVLHFYIFVYG